MCGIINAISRHLNQVSFCESIWKTENRVLLTTSNELEDEWDARNLLYSLRFDLGTAILIPGCNQREV